MAMKHVVLALVLAITVLSFDVSARRLFEDDGLQAKIPAQNFEVAGHEEHDEVRSSTDFGNMEEMDRLKWSINMLICDAMDEGCDHMEDALNDSDHTNESLDASSHPHSLVSET